MCKNGKLNISRIFLKVFRLSVISALPTCALQGAIVVRRGLPMTTTAFKTEPVPTSTSAGHVDVIEATHLNHLVRALL